jgi:hypothetical protein
MLAVTGTVEALAMRRNAAVAADFVAKAPSGAMQPHLQGATRDSESRRGGGGILTIEVHAPDDFRVVGSQPVEEPHAAPAGSRSVDDRVVYHVVERRIGAADWIARRPAVMVGNGVAQNAVEPGPRAGRLCEGCGTLGGAREGPLHDIFGIGLACDAPSSDPHETSSLPAESRDESVCIHTSNVRPCGPCRKHTMARTGTAAGRRTQGRKCSSATRGAGGYLFSASSSSFLRFGTASFAAPR